MNHVSNRIQKSSTNTCNNETNISANELKRSYHYIDYYLDLLQKSVYPYDVSMAPGHEKATKEVLHWIPVSCIDIIDIGCGGGWTVKKMREEYAMNAIGLSLSPVDAQNEEHVILGDMSFIPFDNKNFDLVYSRHSIEHSFSPLLTLMEFNRVLRNDGYVLIVVPVCNSHWIADTNHYSVLHPMQWKRLFQDAGFSLVREETGNFGIPGYNDNEPINDEVRFLLKKDSDIMSANHKDFLSVAELDNIGKTNIDSADLKEAKRLLDEHLKLHPADLDALYMYAEVCYKLGHLDKATESIDNILLFDKDREGVKELTEKINERLNSKAL